MATKFQLAILPACMLSLGLTACGGGGGGGGSTDDPASPELTIVNSAVLEGDSGTTDLQFTVTSDTPASEDLTISYSTVGGTATAGSDYTAVSGGSVTIPAGSSSGTVTIAVTGDTEIEDDETIELSFTAPDGTTYSATATITDDDLPQLSVTDASEAEGDSGTQNLVFTIALSEPVAGDVSFDVSTADGTATEAGGDYSAVSQSETIPAGQTSTTVVIPVAGDTTVENDETLSLTLSNVSGDVGLGNASATGTIENDDFAVVSVSDANAGEGDGSMTFTVELDQPSTADITVDVSTANGNASAGSDFDALAAQQITVPAGAGSSTFNVTINEDDLVEPDETFSVSLANPQNATLGNAQATGTIVDNDTPRLSISDAQISEGDAGEQPILNFTVSLSEATGEDVTVNVSTANGTASAGSDYTALTAQQFTVPAGAQNATVSVVITGDATVEGDESFTVSLSGASANALIDGTAASATGTINNDDSVDVSADTTANVDEGDDGTAELIFTVTLSAAADVPTLIDYSLSPGSATTGTGTAEDDYVDASGTLTIPAGQISDEIIIKVHSDTVVEGAETLNLLLTAQDSSRANVTTASVVGTINNDDRPVLSIDDTSVTEGGDGQTTQLVFTVSMDQTADEDVTVEFASADATAGDIAEEGSDYSANSGTLTIPAGEFSATISVDVSGDEEIEADEMMTMTISNASANAEIGSGQGSATGTIENDDKPSVNIAESSAFEGDIGDSNSVDFTVTLSSAANGIVDIDYSTSNGTASDGVDYTGTAMATLSIPAGETSGTISIPVIGDLDVEADEETFNISLTGSSANAEISTADAVGMILDDDDTTLNDTGVTSCADADENNLDCPATGVPMQDADTGRDATLNDDSDGLAGFKFTKLDASGAELAADASDWTCVRDDVTGLIWEVKANDGGDRDGSNTYSWYDGDLEPLPGDPVEEPIPGLDDGDPATIDNTEAYVDAVNASELCGYSDWRLPNVSELFSLTDLGSAGSPALDTAYFPNTADGLYWTGVSHRDTSGFPGHVWGIDFTDGHLTPTDKTSLQSIRLVRGE